MKSKMIFTKAIIALAATAAITAFGIHAHERHESPMRAMFKELDLTDQQKQDVRSIMKQSKQDGKIYKQDLQNIKKQLTALIRATSWDKEAVVALLEQEEVIKSKLSLASATKRNAVWNTLTSEQQQELAEMNEEGRKPKGDKKRSPMRMFKRLDLSDEQSTKIEALLVAQKATMETQRDSVKILKEQAKDIVRSEDFDQDAWSTINQQMLAAHLDMATEMSSVRHQVWNILDEDQQAKMAKLSKKRDHRKGGERGDKKRHQDSDEV